jgi:AcrR family transcriptional regulator
VNRGEMKTKQEDRRLMRSRRLLGNALIQLMQEKRYIDITVQNIIDRADVGRTTFYKHFQDKEDLLISNLEAILDDFIHHMDSDGDDQMLLSTADFFRHVKEHPDLYKAMLGGQGMDVLFNKGQAMMSLKIENHLDSLPIKRGDLPIPIPVLSNYLAGSFLILLKWWVDHKLAYSPEQMNAMYQQLVMPGTLKVLGVE